MFRTLLCTSLLLMALSVSAQQDIKELVDNLVTLRGQVEDLQSELKIQTEEHKNKMAYLSTRRAELEANRDRERLRVTGLENDLKILRVRIAELGSDSETLIPDVMLLIEQIQANLETGIPFKQVERAQAINDTRLKLEGRKITAQKAVNELWAFLEDEIRITRENAIYSQTITLNGQSVLADVAKLGTVMMYFRTRDEQYGQAVRRDNGWSYQIIDDSTSVEQIKVLFDSLQKQIRQGYFELPGTISIPAS